MDLFRKTVLSINLSIDILGTVVLSVVDWSATESHSASKHNLSNITQSRRHRVRVKIETLAAWGYLNAFTLFVDSH